MNFWHWLRGGLSVRYTAMRLYRRGMKHAKLHDHPAAIADYTQVIELAEAPPKIRAMALFNRALVHSSTENKLEAINDLRSLLEMVEAPAEVKTEAQRKLVRMDRNLTREPSPQGNADINSSNLTG